MASVSKTKNDCIAAEWLEEDNLMLLECWARDGYTFQDVANKIGINVSTLKAWRKQYPEIDEALKKGREIIDYKVENALLKSALGYRTKETKVTTIMRRGVVVETQTETISKEQAPNVSACQCWLFNRLPDKWKRNRDNLIELDEEDTAIHVTVTRASQKTTTSAQQNDTTDEDAEWQDEVNQSIEIRSMTEEERAQRAKEKEGQAKKGGQNKATKVELEPVDESDDLDYWPDDWEDDDDWEE